MSRTNIDIDDELLARAMSKYNLPTKKAAVDLALRRLVGVPLQGDDLANFLLTFEGIGWEGDLDAMRNDKVEDLG